MRVIAVVVAAALASGCVTIFKGTSQTVTITTDPPGADVTVGPHRVKTPARVKLAKRYRYTVLIRKAGYQPTHTVIAAVGLEPLYWLNYLNVALFGIGFSIDYADCAAARLPAVVNVRLEPLPGAQP
jgi:hypothetical protein